MSRSLMEDFSRPCPRDGYYDVFISFRGEDTRSGFTDTLNRALLENEVYTFIDADLAGNEIETLFKIIERSRMAVVVYSENFAASDWCLRELETIMQRWKEKKMLMIPIFYKINAHDLKHPTKKTTRYFDNHMKKYDEHVVGKWKDAVIKIGNVSGFPYKDVYTRSERDFIKTHIIPTIKKKLREWGETDLQSSTVNPYNNTPALIKNHHDVFISFLGEDTRYDFVSHLYEALMNYRKDIKIFMEDRDHLKNDSMFEVIRRSKMSIIIFSKNYVSSKWCLRELVKILQCSNTTEHGLLPIFYEQADNGRIAYYLEKHGRNEELETVQSWRDAITDLDYTVGWCYSPTKSKTGELAYFIQRLVEEISTILNRVDEKKESTTNQQAKMSAEEKNTQVVVGNSSSWSGEECLVSTGESSSAHAAEVDTELIEEEEIRGGVALKKLELEEVMSCNDEQQQAYEGSKRQPSSSRSGEECPVSIGESSSAHAVEVDTELIEKEEIQGEVTLKMVDLEDELSCNNEQQQADESFAHTNATTTGEEKVYRIITSAYFQKSRREMKGNVLLNIKPSRTLVFYVGPNRESSSCLILTNTTDNYVAFQIQFATDQALKYRVCPSEGLLLPCSTCQVIVTIEAQSILPPNLECSNDKVIVQSVITKKDSYSMDDFSAMFTEKYSRTAIHKHTMSVSYWKSQLDPSIPDHHAQLASKGFIHKSESVLSIDIHPKKPWVLLGLIKIICIWNYETRAEEKSFNLCHLEYVVCVKFVHEKHWIVVGYSKGSVCVYDYNTLREVKEFKAHEEIIKCVAVHPNLPYVLTTSKEKLIKLWNWENDWACSETFEHSYYVTQVAFNPNDSTSFASASWDGTIKVWNFDSSVAKLTIEAHDTILTCVEYLVGNNDKLYILSGSTQKKVGVLDYDSKTLLQTLEGHLKPVRVILVHPELPIVITGSDDKTIHIWNKNTFRLELVWTCDLGRVQSIGYIKATDEVVLGCEDGMTVIKIVDAETLSD